jgi:outer membrane protein assembly factor BamB
MLARSLGIIVCFGFVSTVHAEPWSRFRGPNGTGIADGQNIPVEFDLERGVLWKTPIPGDGNSSPMVWDKHIFLQTSNNKGQERLLICLDATNGKIRWQRSIPAIDVTLPVASSSLASASPAVDGEAVYIPIWDGTAVHLMAYSFKGDLIWNKTLSRWFSQHGPGSSPVVVGNKVILAYDMDLLDPKGNPVPEAKPSALMAFNKKTGDLAWETPRPGYRACYSAPFLLQRNGAGSRARCPSPATIRTRASSSGTMTGVGTRSK